MELDWKPIGPNALGAWADGMLIGFVVKKTEAEPWTAHVMLVHLQRSTEIGAAGDPEKVKELVTSKVNSGVIPKARVCLVCDSVIFGLAVELFIHGEDESGNRTFGETADVLCVDCAARGGNSMSPASYTEFKANRERASNRLSET